MSATNLNSASHPIQASSKPSTEAIPQSSTADANMTDSVTAAEGMYNFYPSLYSKSLT